MKPRKNPPASPPGAAAQSATLQSGLVIASHGRHCVVETANGQRVLCHPRGKNNLAVAGDRVLWQASLGEGSIERIEPRRNLLHRQDEMRTKSFAANIDQALILLAAEPVFSEQQLARALIACQAAGIAALIALNKADLAAPFALAWQRLAPYRRMGCAVLPLAAAPHAPLPASTAPPLTAQTLAAAHLAGRATLVLGPSGAGKSTLINALIPHARAATGALSQALGSGRHTTTVTTWYWLDGARSGALIDSPGFQEFGLRHIAPAQLAHLMPDIAHHLGHCRFYNCTRLHEPGCGVRAAISESGESSETSGAPPISPARYRLYTGLFNELAS